MPSTPRLPERVTPVEISIGDFHVDEVAADHAGSMSPYGPDVEFPWPLEKLRYEHPGPENRPNLAEGR
jgi:hypothetical protein